MMPSGLQNHVTALLHIDHTKHSLSGSRLLRSYHSRQHREERNLHHFPSLGGHAAEVLYISMLVRLCYKGLVKL